MDRWARNENKSRVDNKLLNGRNHRSSRSGAKNENCACEKLIRIEHRESSTKTKRAPRNQHYHGDDVLLLISRSRGKKGPVYILITLDLVLQSGDRGWIHLL